MTPQNGVRGHENLNPYILDLFDPLTIQKKNKINFGKQFYFWSDL